MLYQHWQQTLSAHPDAVAVIDAVTGLRHRFIDLQNAIDILPPLKPRSFHAVSIQEGSLPFILQTLLAWRDDAVLCPVDHAVPLLDAAYDLPAHICHIKVTSGSTGEARMIMFGAEPLIADAENIRVSMKLDTKAPNVAVISLAHSYGFSNLVLPLLLQGHPLILVPDALPSSLRLAFEQNDKLTLPAVPAMWRAWFHIGLLKDSPIALAISAGAPLPIDLEQSVYTECGLKIHNFYGSSECGGIAYDDADVPRIDAAYAGRALHGVSLSCSVSGNIMVQSNAVGLGYVSVGPEDAATLRNGQFVAGDLVELVDDQVFLRGRMSDAINIAGKKLNPSEVETALLTHPSVKHCVVFGVPSADSARCEETVACIHTIKGVTEEHLTTHLREKLAPWQMPRRYWLCDKLAPNVRGKISRSKWRNLWLKDREETPLYP